MQRIAFILALSVLAATACGQEGDAPAVLGRLDRETRALYESVQASVVRVQLPPPKWVADLLADDHPVGKWKDLDPAVRSKLESQQRSAASGRVDPMGTVLLPPSTRPAPVTTTQPSADQPPLAIESRIDRGDSQLLVITRPGRGADAAAARQSSAFMPNNIAIVIDDRGHLLVPIYLESDQLTQAVRVSVGPGEEAAATFVGSDRQTNLTVLKADRPIGRPARFSDAARPAPGQLVMILSPANDSARLAVWTDAANEWGVVVELGGAIAGFARHGQFLGGALTRPVVAQLIESGRVRRPTLGVIVLEVRADDPLRRRLPALGTRPALLVRSVQSGSAAAAAGMRADDLILALDGRAVGDIPTFAAAITAAAGQVRLTLLRDGEELTLTVTPTPAP